MTLRKVLTALCCATALIVPANSFAQGFSESLDVESIEIYNVRRYSIENNLCSNNVQAVAKDHNGLIWIGTNDGINSFDGYDFRQYLSNPTDTTTISGKEVSDIKQFSKRYIFFAVVDGELSAYDRYRNIFVSGKNVRNILPGFDIDNETVHGMALADDYFYFALDDKIKVYDKEHQETFDISMPSAGDREGVKRNRVKLEPMVGNSRILIANAGNDAIGIIDRTARTLRVVETDGIRVNDICPINKSVVMLATDEGLYFYDVNERQFGKDNRLGNVAISTITRADNSVYWIVYNSNRIAKWEIRKNKVTDVRNAARYLGEQGAVNSLMCDDSDIIWVSTSNRGLVKLDTSLPRIERITVPVGLSANYITNDIWVSNLQEIWASCGRDGLVKINGETKKCEKFVYPDYAVRSVYVRRNGDMLVSTDEALTRFDAETQQLVPIEIEVPNDVSKKIAINSVVEDCLGNIWVGTQTGLLRYNGASFCYVNDSILGSAYVNAVFEDREGRLWVGARQGVFVKDINELGFRQLKNDKMVRHVMDNTLCFADCGKNVMFGTSAGVVTYIKDSQKMIPTSFNQVLGNAIIYSIVYDKNEDLWLSTNSGVFCVDMKSGISYKYNHLDGLVSTGTECKKMFAYGDTIFFGCADKINYIDVNRSFDRDDKPRAIISEVLYGQSGGEKPMTMENDTLYSAKFLIRASIKVKVSSTDMSNVGRNEYWFHIDDEAPTLLSNARNEIVIPGFMPGKHTLSLYTINGSKETSDVTRVIIHIKPQLWISNPALIFYVVMLSGLVWLLVDMRFSRVNKRMKEMEKQRKTAEMIVSQRNKLMKINQDQVDSINYAKRIQDSIMPTEAEAQAWFDKLFVYYKPKDIVSGDFYCFYHRDGKTYVVAGDCTGHGVPGAFISILGIDHLHDIIMNHRVEGAGNILTQLHAELHDTIFKKNTDDGEFNEGMDVTLCVVDHKNMTIDFAGAMNDIYVIRDNEVFTYRGNRFSIGTNLSIGSAQVEVQYDSTLIECQKGDIFYMFSDGFADQFGGPEQKKFKYRRFKHLLMNIHELPARDQKQVLHQKHEEWKGKNDQTDDILVLGFQPWN